MEKLIKGLTKKEYGRQWKLKNPEKCREAVKRWDKKHREYKREYKREWFQENKERIYGVRKACRLRKKLEKQNNKQEE